MKKYIKRGFTIVIAAAILAYGIHWAFYDIQHIHGQEILQEILQEIPSPGSRMNVMTGRVHDGSTRFV